MSVSACLIHSWQLSPSRDEYLCVACEASTSPCRECGKPLIESRAVCSECVRRATRVVADVWEWFTEGHRQDPYEPLKAITYDREPVSERDDDERLPFGLDAVVSDPEDGRIASLRRVDDAVRVLEKWADTWRRHGGVVSEITDPLAFLVAYTEWAILNPADSYWTLYIRDARQVRAVVRRLLGLEPVREPVPCVHCGGRIVHEWREDGLDDVARCTGCGIEWEHTTHLRFANRHFLKELPETRPDELVTLAQLKEIFGDRVRPKLLDLWVHRRKIEATDSNARGARLYRLGDATPLVDEYLSKRSPRASA